MDFLERGLGINQRISAAIRSGNFAEFKELVALYGLPSQNLHYGSDYIKYALYQNRLEFADFLIESGVELWLQDLNFSNFKHPIENGHLAVVNWLLSKGASVNMTCAELEGHCPLILAVMKNEVAITKLLLLNHADVNAADKNGFTPLHHAASNENVEIMECLLDHGANVNSCGTGKYKGKTPLHEACSNSTSADAIELLLERGAELEASDENGKTPLSCAFQCGVADIVRMLLKKGAVLKREHLLDAIDSYRPEVVDIVLKTGGYDVNEKFGDKIALHYAVSAHSDYYRHSVGSLDIVRLILDYGADVHAEEEGKNALMLAAEGRTKHALLPVLLDHGADWISVNGKTLLHVCAEKSNDPQVLQTLLERGAEVEATDETGETPLFYAVRGGQIRNIDTLVKWGADVNAEREGKTALRIAVEHNQFSLIPRLLHHGADPNWISDNGRTLLHICAEKCFDFSCTAIKSVLERGADVNALTDDGETPLHLAVTIGNFNVVEVLLEWPYVDIDARDKEGCTALLKVVDKITYEDDDRGRLQIFEDLLQHGADTNIQNNKGFTFFSHLMEICLASEQDPYFDPMRISLGYHHEALNVAGLYVRDKDVSDTDPHSATYCEEEIVKMKNEKVGSSNISYYDILTKNSRQWAYITQNSNVNHALENAGCLRRFQIYGNLVYYRFKRAKERVPLLEKAIPALENVFHLPELCCYLITDFLSNADLKRFIDSVESNHVL